MPSRTPKAEPPLEPFEIESDRRRERPILFSAEMVRAILAGRKTQTRRVVKRNDVDLATDVDELADCWRFSYQDGNGIAWTDLDCPYGKPGDRLWVRENFRYHSCDAAGAHIEYQSDGRVEVAARHGDVPNIKSIKFNLHVNGSKVWKPSIHMPRWASRITLEVTEVRVERVQEISEEDAIAEGIKSYNDGLWKICTPTTSFGTSNPRKSFESLWESINGTKHPWAANPWVWVVSFKRVEATP